MSSSAEEIRRKMEESMRARTTRDVNARIPEPPAAEDNKTRLKRIVAGVYEVHLPRRGRLGDLAVLDEQGNPINASPREFGPKADKAVAHFSRVARAFDRINGYE